MRLLKVYNDWCKNVIDEVKYSRMGEDENMADYRYKQNNNISFLSRLILQLKATLLSSFP